MITSICLPDLPIAHYHFDLALQQAATLPAYLGALLRGGFGLAFKDLVCLQKQLPDCRACLLLHTCTYPMLFEAIPPSDPAVLKSHDRIPAPYVLAPPPIHTEPWSAGEIVHFQLTLMGRGILHLPYFVLAFRQLGQMGLGRQRTPARLQRVWAVNSATGQQEALWQGEQLRPDWQQWGGWRSVAPADSAHCPTLTLHFLTPTRLKYDDQILQAPPPFHVVIRTLLRRVSSLSYFHGGQRWETDYRGWIARAEAVTTSAAAVEWHDWSRYSTRTQQRMPLGGLVGSVTYAGDLTPFLPLLRLGEVIHVGKNAVFGNGRFVIEGETGRGGDRKTGRQEEGETGRQGDGETGRRGEGGVSGDEDCESSGSGGVSEGVCGGDGDFSAFTAVSGGGALFVDGSDAAVVTGGLC